MSFFLVVAPVALLGFQVYNTFQSETFVNTEKDLKNIAKDWFNTTEVYILEQDRILKREEFLYQKRLESVTLGAEGIIELVSDSRGQVPESEFAKALKKIAEIKIGSSGNVLMFNSKGDTFVLQNKVDRADNLFKMTSSSTALVFSDAIKKIVALKDKETIVLNYTWADDGRTEGPRQKMAVFTYFKSLDLIIGTTAYTTDFKSGDLNDKLISELKDLMSQQKIGERGYIWAINSQGDYLVSKNMYRNGENIINEKDQAGNFTIKDIIDNSTKLARGDSYIHYYPWKNIGEKTDSMMVSATVYVPEWDWIIGVSAYSDDFLKGLDLIRLQIIYTVFFTVSVGLLLAYLFASLLSHPIKKLEQVAIQAAEGNLEQGVDQNLTKKTGEIGNLARSFEIMIINLRSKIHTLNSVNSSLEETKKEVEEHLTEVSRMNKLMIDRELRMIELKKRIKELEGGADSTTV